MINKRQHRYITVQKILKLAKQQKKTGCIQFPHFGATYPDACCDGGYLWDLDSCDENMLTSGGNDPCPVCNTRLYAQYMLENIAGTGRMLAHIKFIFSRYGNLNIKNTKQ